jgi:hypothetical protein
MKTRAEWEAEPMLGNQRAEVLALLDERDAMREMACADGECGECHYCTDAMAWNAELGKANAERDAALADAARLTTARDNEWLRALETESVCCAPLTPRQIFDAVCTRDAKVRSEQAITDYEGYAALLRGFEALPPPRELADALTEHDARVRIAALADAPFVAAAIEAARLKALDVAIAICRPWAESGPSQGASVASAIAEEIRALKETNPPPAKPCATCHRDADHVGGRFGPPCPECTEVKR